MSNSTSSMSTFSTEGVKHTPGPWEARSIGIGPARVYASGKGGALIATPGYLRDEEQEIANARLIAAAPELLEALQKIAAYRPLTFAECSEAEAVIGIAEAAIALVTKR